MSTVSLPPGQRELKAQLKKLIRLVEISIRLNSTMDPEQLVQSIIESATELLDCEAASLLLVRRNHPETALCCCYRS